MRFKLIKQHNGVVLRCYPEEMNGVPIGLLIFRRNGRISRLAGIPEDLGFQVDERGRILLTQERR